MKQRLTTPVLFILVLLASTVSGFAATADNPVVQDTRTAILDSSWRSARGFFAGRQVRKIVKQLEAGDAAKARRQFDEARAFYEHALKTAEGVENSDRVRVSVFYRLGQLSEEQGSPAEASSYLETASTHARYSYGNASIEVAICDNALTRAYAHDGHLPEAQMLVPRIIKTYSLYFGPEHRETIDVERQLSAVMLREDPQFALDRLTHALRAITSVGLPNRRELQQVSCYIAVAHYYLGHYAEAVSYAERAQELVADEVTDELVPDIAWIHGMTLYRLGAYDRAIPELVKARSLYVSRNRGGSNVAANLSGAELILAKMTARDISHPEISIDFAKSSLDRMAVSSDSVQARIQAADELLETYVAVNSRTGAIEMLEQRMMVLDPAADQLVPATATRLDTVVDWFVRSGDFASSERYVRYALRGLNNTEAAPAKIASRKGRLLRALARAQIHNGDLDQAIQTLRASADALQTLPKDHTTSIATTVLLAHTLAMRGSRKDNQEAYALFLSAFPTLKSSPIKGIWEANTLLGLVDVRTRVKPNEVRDNVDGFNWAFDLYRQIERTDAAMDCKFRLLKYLRTQSRYAEADSILRDLDPTLLKRSSDLDRLRIQFWRARTLLDRRLVNDATEHVKALHNACAGSHDSDMKRVCRELLQDLKGPDCRTCESLPLRPRLIDTLLLD